MPKLGSKNDIRLRIVGVAIMGIALTCSLMALAGYLPSNILLLSGLFLIIGLILTRSIEAMFTLICGSS
jgi:hypothetical protein